MTHFLYYYFRSMRLYYGFVTGTTVLWGILHANPANYAPCTRPFSQLDAKAVAALIIGFLVWGVNQIFSDYLDRKEDSINASHRPMVTGALPPRPALLCSAVIMLLFTIASASVSLWTLPVLFAGAILNAAYSLLKKLPVINFIVYSCAITCCAIYGYAGILNRCPDINAIAYAATLFLPIHCLMCHNSYYKDVEGDRAVGVRTLQTCFSRAVSLGVSIILFAVHILQIAFRVMPPLLPKDFVPESMMVQVFLLILLIVMLIRNISRMTYHKATLRNCQLCVAMLYTPMLMHTEFMLIPELLSLLTIEILFLWYRDEKE